MKKITPIPLLLLLFVSLSASSDNYLMWQLPGKGISLPVYIYQNNKQIDFIPSISLQYFAGKFTPNVTSASYQLYYQQNNKWFGCTVAIKVGKIDNKNTTCSGATITNPIKQNGATSNVYTLGFGAKPWPVIPAAPTPQPAKTDYSNRTIAFENNTDFQMIQIGESCDTGNASNAPPSCQNSPIIASIEKGKSHTISVGANGLNSAAFYLSSYCNASSVAKCGTAPTASQCASTPTPTPPAHWVCTGGYFAGQTPYATKIEPTILTVKNGIPSGASNVDVSAVDGFSIGVKLYPASNEYCTYTVPPENSNVLGAGEYFAKSPLAQVKPQSSSSLEQLCKSSSQLPKGHAGTAWDLTKYDTAGDFQGCMSPCAYATANVNNSGITSDTVNKFCCIGSYNTPATCDMPTGVVGANNSTYNTNIQGSASFQNVYGFAYGDAGSDYACPPETNFIVEFISQ